MEANVLSELGRTLEVLESIWNNGTIRQNGLPGDATEKVRLQRLLAAMVEAQTLILTMAAEKRPPQPQYRGVVFDGLQNLQKKLETIQELVRRVADGDFSRRLDSNGEFGSAFNEMIKNMEDNRHRLRRHDAELFEINSRLQSEVEVRMKAQEELELANSTLQSQILEIQCLQAKLREQAIRDSLTSLFNRRYLEETLERELAVAARSLSSLTIILLDLDHFKDFNDQYGHAAGDTVLRILSSLLRGNTRSSDVACRYGGEEFIVVLPNVRDRSCSGTGRVSEDDLRAVRDHVWGEDPEGHPLGRNLHFSHARLDGRRAHPGGGYGPLPGERERPQPGRSRPSPATGANPTLS